MSEGLYIRCLKCGDEINSKYQHDFRECSCKAIAIDGGGAYTRIIGDDWEYVKDEKDNCG